MPVMTVWKVLRKRLDMRPYCLQLLQALKPTDYAVRSNFAHEMLHDHLISNLPELRDRIREAVVAVTPDILIKVWGELAYRLDVCRVTNGARIEHL
ncbi:hypothetical protein C0J52_04477 [Blattella germanica]|nr:hypothetical protein C0J52_04477 [Blattella germanica]